MIPNGIEEMLRYEAPSPVNARWVNQDLEYYGQAVPKDSKLILLNGSADRDERHFNDPDVFDVRRTIDRHTAFGYGTHFCVGQSVTATIFAPSSASRSADTEPTLPKPCTATVRAR